MEVNPFINHSAIENYIKKSFHQTGNGVLVEDEEDKEALQKNQQRIKDLLKETSRRKDKLKRMLEEGIYDKYMLHRA